MEAVANKLDISEQGATFSGLFKLFYDTFSSIILLFHLAYCFELTDFGEAEVTNKY